MAGVEHLLIGPAGGPESFPGWPIWVGQKQPRVSTHSIRHHLARGRFLTRPAHLPGPWGFGGPVMTYDVATHVNQDAEGLRAVGNTSQATGVGQVVVTGPLLRSKHQAK